MKFCRTRIRIVTDTYCGYEVQVKHWWFPIWLQKGGTNTFHNLDGARQYARSSKFVEFVEQ